jgi:succinate dehydrogenase/fumarate reductase flavoprotein subunit
MSEIQFDEHTDVVVVGSGGGALVGALIAAQDGLDTIVIESTEYFGGTTAYSGSGLWLPGNQAQARAGVEDSVELAREYLRATVGDRTAQHLQDAFLEAAAPMVARLEEHPAIEFEWRPFPDYFASLPSGLEMGRDIFPLDINGSEVGEILDLVRPSQITDRLGMEIPRDVLTGGQALISRLMMAVSGEDRAQLRNNTALENLITDDNGDVIGVEVATTDGLRRIGTRRGVLMAAGGFERNDALRKQYQAPLDASWTNGAPGSMGRPIVAGIEIGAATDLMEECWWCPGTLFPDGSAVFTLGVSGGVIVNQDGRRFMNEALPYDRAGREIRSAEAESGGHIPCYLIFDSRDDGAMPATATVPVLDPAAFIEAGVWKTADSLDGLADQLGIPAANLNETVDRYNGFVAGGVDDDFHRGEEPFDKFFATGTEGPNPALRPVDAGPFYAATIVLSDLGTKGGLKTDGTARVVREDGTVINGLYAAGNTMASVMGECYPGPGTPIGSCMVFSYLAALDMSAAA